MPDSIHHGMTVQVKSKSYTLFFTVKCPFANCRQLGVEHRDTGTVVVAALWFAHMGTLGDDCMPKQPSTLQQNT